MNLVLCVEAYFGRLADETVAPILYRDGSSYERMSETWADERPLPSEEDLIAWYNDTGAGIISAWEANQASVPTVAELQAQLALLEQAMLDMLEGL